ncbi:MAG TPA: hypothetical protein VIJ99_03365 [Acidimicrobiales bacterium]
MPKTYGSTFADAARLDRHLTAGSILLTKSIVREHGEALLSASSQTARSATALVQPPNIPFADS